MARLVPEPTLPLKSPPMQNGLTQPVTAPVPVGRPLEPYWNWYGTPPSPNAVPCSGPFVIRPYFEYWYCCAFEITRYCGRPSPVWFRGRTE